MSGIVATTRLVFVLILLSRRDVTFLTHHQVLAFEVFHLPNRPCAG